jgi:NhaP-type Na+/H+ and K+/H+ antiporter
VVDADRKLVGIGSATELGAGYRLDLTPGHTADQAGRVLIELEIDAGSDIVGRRVGDLGLPSGSLVVALSRRDRPLVPTAETEVEPHDTLGVLTRADDVVCVRQYLATDPKQGAPEKGHGPGPGGLI